VEEWQKNKNAAQQTLKEKSLPAPFTFATRRLSPIQPASGWREINGRASENFSPAQAICAAEIPPCSPLRAELKRTLWPESFPSNYSKIL